jgi:hypothetical protein
VKNISDEILTEMVSNICTAYHCLLETMYRTTGHKMDCKFDAQLDRAVMETIRLLMSINSEMESRLNGK